MIKAENFRQLISHAINNGLEDKSEVLTHSLTAHEAEAIRSQGINPNKPEFLDLYSKMDRYLSRQVENETPYNGVNFSDAKRYIDNEQLYYSLYVSKNDVNLELTEDDILLIPDVLRTPNEMILRANSDGNPHPNLGVGTLEYYKEVGDLVYIVLEDYFLPTPENPDFPTRTLFRVMYKMTKKNADKYKLWYNTLKNDEFPELRFLQPGSSIQSDGSQVFELEVSRWFPNDDPTSAWLVKLGGNAVEGQDYEFIDSSKFTFQPEDGPTKKIRIRFFPNFSGENKSLEVGFDNINNAEPNQFPSYLFNIGQAEEDGLSVVSFETESEQAREGQRILVPVILNKPAEEEILAFIGQSGGNAIEGEDWSFYGGGNSVFFQPGETKKFIELEIFEDAYDPNESIVLEIFDVNGPGYPIPNGTLKNHTVEITEDYQLPIVQFEFTGRSYLEPTTNSESAFLSVVSDKVDQQAFSVDFRLVPDETTATEGTDFELPTLKTLTWNPGDDLQKSIEALILDDTDIEGTEEFVLELHNPQGCSIGSQSAMTVTITDTDNAPVPDVEFLTGGVSVTEGTDSQFEVQIRCNNLGSEAVTATIESAGTATHGQSALEGSADFFGAISPITWNPGDAAVKTITLGVVDDAEIEGTETATLTISGVQNGNVGAANECEITIQDNDFAPTPSVVFLTGGVLVTEGQDPTFQVQVKCFDLGSDPVTATIVNSGAATHGQTVFDGNPDFYGDLSPITWNPGDPEVKTISLTLNDDTEIEGTETSTLTITAVQNGDVGTENECEITIQDNDFADPVVEFDTASFSANEEAGQTILVPISCVNRGSEVVSVEFGPLFSSTATINEDYLIQTGSPLTWNPGDPDTKEIQIQIQNDAWGENQEKIVLGLENLSPNATFGDQITSTIFINDTDEVSVAFRAPEVRANEGENVSLPLVVRNLEPGKTVDVNIRYVPGSSGTTATDSDWTFLNQEGTQFDNQTLVVLNNDGLEEIEIDWEKIQISNDLEFENEEEFHIYIVSGDYEIEAPSAIRVIINSN